MMKMKLKSRIFEKLQGFTALSTKSEKRKRKQNLRKSGQISLTSAEIATNFEKMQTCIAKLENAKQLTN